MGKNRAIQVIGLLLFLVPLWTGTVNAGTTLLWWAGLVMVFVGSWKLHKAKKARRQVSA